MAMLEDIKHRLSGIKNKLKRVKQSRENSNHNAHVSKLYGEKKRLEEEIRFLKYLIKEYSKE
jgi:archaellum component FlaC